MAFRNERAPNAREYRCLSRQKAGGSTNRTGAPGSVFGTVREEKVGRRLGEVPERPIADKRGATPVLRSVPKQPSCDRRGGSLSTAVSASRPASALPILMLMAVVLGSSSGCSILKGVGNAVKSHEGCDEFMIAYRNRAMAAKAWHREKHALKQFGNSRDLKAGFYAGYMEVAEGGSGCTPAICPSSYSGWRYQSASGQQACDAWFQGFPLGAAAAEQDGVGNWSHVRFAGHSPYGAPPMQETDPASLEDDPEQIVPGSIEYEDGEPFPDAEIEEIAPPLPSIYDEAAGMLELDGNASGSGIASSQAMEGGVTSTVPSDEPTSLFQDPQDFSAAGLDGGSDGISFRFE